MAVEVALFCLDACHRLTCERSGFACSSPEPPFKENGGRALVQKTRYNKTSFVAEKLKFTFCLDNEQYSVLKMGI